MRKGIGLFVLLGGFVIGAGVQEGLIGVCGGTMSENVLLINVRAGHTYKINMEPTRLAAIPGVIAKFEAARAVKQVFILPEKEATYVEVQELVDTLLKTVPGLQVGVIQGPTDAGQKCVAGAPTGVTTKFFVKIPLPVKPVGR